MSELGDLLKQTRIEKGLSLEQLEETTKIRKRYLEAIEDGEFHVLPGNFYVRAFIKNYAENVGLDPAEVLQLYQDVIPSREVTNVTMDPPAPRRRKSANFERFSKWASAFLMICFLLLILGLIYYYFSEREPQEQSVLGEVPITEKSEADLAEDEAAVSGLPESPSATVPPPEPEPEPVDEVEPELTYVSRDGSTDIYNLSYAESMEVEVSVVGTLCWVLVLNQNNVGERIFEANLRQGESETFELDDSVWIRVGNAAAISISVNGNKLDAIDHSNPFNFQINLVKDEADS